MRILFGVFDWGLGHATRDLPLLEELLRHKHTVHIVSTGRALALLQEHFGARCTYFDVPSVGNPYTKTRFHNLSVILQSPRLIRNLRNARRHVEAILKKHHYHKVISDCRYDVYDTPKNSYLINHQVRFKSFPGGQIVAEWWLAKRQKRYRFIMVPDFETGDISGHLSHDLKIIPRERIRYIGVLSQVRDLGLKKDIDYFISISGPEPQRTILEEVILLQLHELRGKVVVTLGKPGAGKRVVRKGKVAIYPFLGRTAQEQMMNRAKFVITRSGYTTMMELYESGVRHALLIPTPGQSEQEYLAKLYDRRGELHQVSQYRLNLKHDVHRARQYAGFKRQWVTTESVQRFMKALMEK